MTYLFTKKQLEYLENCYHPWNLAHGAVSTGKTVCTMFGFLHAVDCCPDSEIAMIGKTATTIYNNCINLIYECPQLEIYRHFCTWFPSKQELRFKDKTIKIYGAKDEGSVQLIQGRSLSLAYCDEMTLYPDSFIHMLDTRLRKPHSKGYAAMNPAHPTHICKQWIDKATEGDKRYYGLHFTIDDAPYLDVDYIERIRTSLSGLFYKRNYLGLWTLAEGAIFDFFDRHIHVTKKPLYAAEYFVAGIDFGLNNPTACIILGVNTGVSRQGTKHMWVENEYYWDHKLKHRQKTVSELSRDIAEFLEPYGCNKIYIDPSALAMKLDLNKLGIHTVDANNDILEGIAVTTSEMRKGNLTILDKCKHLIREIEGYVWDEAAAKKGDDEPKKAQDHAIDALRYVIATHKVSSYDPYKHNPKNYVRDRFGRQANF